MDLRPTKKQKLQHILCIQMQSSQPEVPQLPDEIIISILFDYYPPKWNIGMVNKYTYTRLLHEQKTLKKIVGTLVKEIFIECARKYKMPDIISHADHIRNITEMRIQLIPKFHRLKQITRRGSVYNRWLPINHFMTIHLKLISFNFDNHRLDILRSYNNHRSTKKYIQYYEMYSLLEPIFNFCNYSYDTNTDDYNMIFNHYRSITNDYLYNYNYLTSKMHWKMIPEVSSIMKECHKLIKNFDIYKTDSMELEYGELILDDVVATINKILESRNKLDQLLQNTTHNIFHIHYLVYTLFDDELYDYINQWDDVENDHENMETLDYDFIIRNRNIRHIYELWYCLESIISDFEIDSQFLQKLKQFSHPGIIFHYI